MFVTYIQYECMYITVTSFIQSGRDEQQQWNKEYAAGSFDKIKIHKYAIIRSV